LPDAWTTHGTSFCTRFLTTVPGAVLAGKASVRSPYRDQHLHTLYREQQASPKRCARTEDDARRMWVNRQINIIKTLRRGNNRKAKSVTWSLRSAGAGHSAALDVRRH
jgi:hypothetical protein